MAKEETTLYSAQLSERHQTMFKEVAQARGQIRSGLLRVWIERAHKAMGLDKTRGNV